MPKFSFNETVYVTDLGRTAKYMYSANGFTMVKWLKDPSNPNIVSFGRTHDRNILSKEEGLKLRAMLSGQHDSEGL